MWLSWRIAALAAAGFAAVGFAGMRGNSRWRAAGAFARETAVVLCLYSVWQVAAALALRRVAGAMTNGMQVWDAERALHLPSELTVQNALLPHPLLVQASNGYYAIVHVPALIAFLIWLFLRHRDRYAAVRNTLAVLTASCLLIQMIPVAPPRLLPELGVADTGVLYHQSVYGAMGTGMADQLSAMPSVHVAWAALIALAVVRVSTSPWRWLVLAHPVLTFLVVTVTGNHFWLDGLAALLLLGVAVTATAALAGLRRSTVWRRLPLFDHSGVPQPTGPTLAGR